MKNYENYDVDKYLVKPRRETLLLHNKIVNTEYFYKNILHNFIKYSDSIILQFCIHHPNKTQLFKKNFDPLKYYSTFLFYSIPHHINTNLSLYLFMG